MRYILSILFVLSSIVGLSQSKVYKINNTIVIEDSQLAPSPEIRLLNKATTRFTFSGNKVGVSESIGKEIFLIDYLDSIQDRNGVDVGDSLFTLNYLTELVADIPSGSFELNVSRGLYSNIGTQFKFGQNPLVGATEEVIWDAGGTYVFLTVPEAMEVVSTDADDSIAGSGAHLLLISGLNADYVETSQVIAMDGLTTVTTDTLFLRVFRAVVLTSGTDSPTQDANEGTITITGADTSTLQAQINPRNGQTLMCVYTVPANKTAYVTGASFGVGEGKQCSFKGKFRNGVGGAFSVKYALTLYESPFFGTFEVPLQVPEKIDIVITGQSTTPSGTQADASFGLILIDNE